MAIIGRKEEIRELEKSSRCICTEDGKVAFSSMIYLFMMIL